MYMVLASLSGTSKKDLHVDHFDRTPGSGASKWSDEDMDENTRVHPNDWSVAQTTFYPDDPSAELTNKQRRYYMKLKSEHDRHPQDGRKTNLRRTEILKDAEAFSNFIELSDEQKERTMNIIREIDLSSQTYGGKPYETIILAVMTLAVDESIDREEEMYKRLTNRQSFEEVLSVTDTSVSDIRKVRQQVRENTDYFSE